MSQARCLVAWSLGAALEVSVLSACGASQEAGAAEADLTRAMDQTSRGARLFEDDCSRCHGRRGAGGVDAPAILGPSALPEFARTPTVAHGFAFQDPQQLEIQQATRSRGQAARGPFRTAQDLHDYVSAHVQSLGARALPPEDGWALVSFMMVAQGLDVPKEGITAGNAASFPVRR